MSIGRNPAGKKVYVNRAILYQMSLCIVTVLILLLVFQTIVLEFDDLLFFISVSGTVSFFLSIYFYYKLTGHFISPYTLFFLSFFLFQFGQSFLLSFGIDYDYYIFERYNTQTVISGTIFSMLGVSVFNLGALISLRRRGHKTQTKLSIIKSKYSLKLCGYSLFFLSFLPAFYLAVSTAIISIQFGYLGTYLHSNNSLFIMVFLKHLFIPSCLLILSSYNYNHHFAKIIRIILYLYTIILLLGGGRTEGLSALTTILCFKFISGEKVNKRLILKFSLLIVLIAILSSGLASFRGNENKSFSTFFQNVADVATDNPLVSTIGEMGYSMSPLFMTMRVVPQQISFKYGESYFASIIGIVPAKLDFLGVVGEFVDRATLDVWLMNYYSMNFGPGFSILAESYYNFGYWGLLFVAILGFILGRILGYSNAEDLRNDRFLLYIKLVGLYSLFTFPRRPNIFFVKQMLYSVILIFLLTFIIDQFTGRNIKKG